MRFIFLPLALTFAIASPAFATNTSSVFGSSVEPEDKSFEYRLAIDPETQSGFNFITSQRFHYQQSVSDRLRLRGIVQWDTNEFDDIEFDYIQAEALYQLAPERNGFVNALRFDLRWRDHDRPGQVRVNWSGQWDLGDDWRVRAIGLSAMQFANGADSDVAFEARAQVSRKVKGVRFGLESFNDLGDTRDFSPFKNNETTLGPFIGWKLADKVPFSLGTQFGLTNGSPDTQIRLFMNYDLY